MAVRLRRETWGYASSGCPVVSDDGIQVSVGHVVRRSSSRQKIEMAGSVQPRALRSHRGEDEGQFPRILSFSLSFSTQPHRGVDATCLLIHCFALVLPQGMRDESATAVSPMEKPQTEIVGMKFHRCSHSKLSTDNQAQPV